MIQSETGLIESVNIIAGQDNWTENNENNEVFGQMVANLTMNDFCS